MKNPPKKPKAPTGKTAKWIPPYDYLRVVGKRRVPGTGKYAKVRRRIEVKGHYRFIPTPPAPPEKKRPRRLPSEWIPALEYEALAVKKNEAVHVDPIYRYNRRTDVVRLSDGLVWDHPIRSDVPDDYVLIRVWYSVHHLFDSDPSIVDPEKVDQYYIYQRTFDLGELSQPNLTDCREELWKKYVPRIEAEYADKQSIEFHQFVAWTAFGIKERKPVSHHSLDTPSPEKSFYWDRRGEKKRELTWWEVGKAVEASKHSFPGLKRRKGESVQHALSRLTPVKRREYRNRLRRILEALEEQWKENRERRGR